jgi:hypothetical protein
MSANLLQVQHYDLIKGMEFVVGWVMVVFVLVLVFGLRSQYRLMNAYDILSYRNSSGEQRTRAILSYVRPLASAKCNTAVRMRHPARYV